MKILCVCLSATIQRTLMFDSFSVGTINRTKNWREDASGKALNAARTLNQLEQGSSLVVCPVGSENADAFMLLASQDSNLYLHPIFVAGKTRSCWTLLETKHTTTEIIADESQDSYHLAGAETELELIEVVREYMQTYDALLFAGSRPAQWSANLCATLCKVALDAGKTVLADFRGNELLQTLHVCTPQIIKINEEEFCQTFGGLLLSEEELTAAVMAKSAELHTIVVVTRGEKDTIAAQDGKCYRCPAEKITAVNTTGCGDSFAAGFLYAYLQKNDMNAALKQATHCAALNAQSVIPGSIA